MNGLQWMVVFRKMHETLVAPIEKEAVSTDLVALRRRLDQLAFARAEAIREFDANSKELEKPARYLQTAEKVSVALEKLNQDLFSTLLGTVQEKITIALQEILEQPITFHAQAGFSRNRASVEFWVERNGKPEDLIPKLVKIIHDASRALGFQVLMISHHERQLFEQYADKIIELQWQNGKVIAVDTTSGPSNPD